MSSSCFGSLDIRSPGVFTETFLDHYHLDICKSNAKTHKIISINRFGITYCYFSSRNIPAIALFTSTFLSNLVLSRSNRCFGCGLDQSHSGTYISRSGCGPDWYLYNYNCLVREFTKCHFIFRLPLLDVRRVCDVRATLVHNLKGNSGGKMTFSLMIGLHLLFQFLITKLSDCSLERRYFKAYSGT